MNNITLLTVKKPFVVNRSDPTQDIYFISYILEGINWRVTLYSIQEIKECLTFILEFTGKGNETAPFAYSESTWGYSHLRTISLPQALLHPAARKEAVLIMKTAIQLLETTSITV